MRAGGERRSIDRYYRESVGEREGKSKRPNDYSDNCVREGGVDNCHYVSLRLKCNLSVK